jgi:hypothetical protein
MRLTSVPPNPRLLAGFVMTMNIKKNACRYFHNDQIKIIFVKPFEMLEVSFCISTNAHHIEKKRVKRNPIDINNISRFCSLTSIYMNRRF